MQGLTVVIAYPSNRRVAFSSLAYHLLRGYLKSSRVGVKGVFLEDGGLAFDGRHAGYSPASSIFISLPYELMYPDMAYMIESLGIPPKSSGRGDGHPILIGGGPAVTANPLPVSGLLDAVLIGEVEPVLDDIMDALSRATRRSRLRALSDIEGVYVPGYSSPPVRRVYVKDLDSAWYPIVQEVEPGVEPVWGNSFILETTRGCNRMCRFCMEGTIFRPKRDRSYGRLVELLEEGIKANKASRVSFYSLIFFDNPWAEKILEHAVSLGLEVSVPSIRAETLTLRRAQLISSGGQRTVTIAPETGSCVIARAILKPIGTDVTLESVRNALEGGIRNIKLYIMTGFPGEGEKELRDTMDLMERVSKLVRGEGGLVKATINPFMPKPVTGMQWFGLEDEASLKRKLRLLAGHARRLGIRASTYDLRWARIQVVLSRGGEELSELIVRWARYGGGLGGYRRALREAGIDEAFYLSTWPPEYTPPWHEVVEHPYAELRMLRRDFAMYHAVLEASRRSGPMSCGGPYLNWLRARGRRGL